MNAATFCHWFFYIGMLLRSRRPLTNIDRVCLGAGLILIAALGAVTLIRSAYLTSRHTDAGVYFRAAWAVSAGQDPYSVTDLNGWHYHYPPLLAFVLVPLAEAPPDMPKPAAQLPYGLSVAIWYVLNVLAAALGIHALASAIEQKSLVNSIRSPVRFGQAWWALRIFPVVACLEPIGHSLGRGQVNPLILFCICMSASALIHRAIARGGTWMALASSIKLFPAYLVVYLLWRAHWRAIVAGLLTACIVLVVVPSLLVGPARNLSMLQSFVHVIVFQILGAEEGERSRELLNFLTGDVMAFKSLYLKAISAFGFETPLIFERQATIVHIGLSLALTGVTLYALRPAGSATAHDPLEPVFAIGLLVTAAVPMIPTAQSHYFMLSAVLVMGLLAHDWETHDNLLPSRPLSAILILFFIFSAIRELPGLHAATHIGAPVIAGLLLWVTGIVVLSIRRARRD